MRWRQSALAGRLSRLRRHLWPTPPALGEGHSLADFGSFMREETQRFSPRYARHLIDIDGREHLLAAAAPGGVMVVFLHYGSWILAGGAIAHRLGLPYTVIASRRNLDFVPPEEKHFWEGVHHRGRHLYGHALFYTDESPRPAMRWLRQRRHVLGVALDVREHGQRFEEHPYAFLGGTIYMQSGPARMARVAGVPMVPAAIQYQPALRRHRLVFEPAVVAEDDPRVTTQRLLSTLEKYVAERPEQQFHDIATEFARPWRQA